LNETFLENTKKFETAIYKGWIQHDLVGGGGALPALVPSCVGHMRRPPINLLDYCKVFPDYSI
jgi:hypothetical protein